jgi:ribosomal protein S18 acetylase RimI-like enzyme
MTVTIRDGSAGDAAGLVPAFAALGYPVEAATLRERLTAMFADDHTARLLVASDESGILGFACLHETPMPHRPTHVGRITAIAVLDQARGSGAGRMLAEAAEAHFRSRGIARIEVTSGDNHAPAHTFYRHLGYSDNGIRFSKALG